MTLPRSPSRGGFRRPFQLSLFVRDYLQTNGPTSGHDLFIAYKTAITTIPLAAFGRHVMQGLRTKEIKEVRKSYRKSGHPILRGQKVPVDEAKMLRQYQLYLQSHPKSPKRRCINYNGFLHYIYLMRQLNLVDYVMLTPTTPKTKKAHQKSNPGTPAPGIKPARLFQLVTTNLGSSAWDNVWQAMYPG